ncbi:RNA polymerase II transcriptional coactivator KELP [Penicillium canariense]|uniref:RNA polymerase II transcriptional coactivator KELP n=1 Tax=Penicillium canariense TaxID=189055 RepID=A0A9W9LE74_9EURO|nr:RNA polymerase II transcriptional coactivator KELP [Penicillium canariense]KAJ5150982.1 RNA polymerase II transcriptional coactivator KELP [Penicillium canariense]
MTSRKRASDPQGPGDANCSQSKKVKATSGNELTSKIDANGDRYWEISKMRRVTISEFRGRTMVSVREYYEKDGQELPGKKGISMSIEQFSALVELLPDLEQTLQQRGESLPRPVYSGAASQVDDEGDKEQSRPDKDASPSKQNIEATSDEDSEA